MKQLLLPLLSVILLSLNISPVLASSTNTSLADCLVVSHCARSDWEVKNVDNSFVKAVKVIERNKNAKVVEKNNSYIHAEFRSRIMHYVDDFEIKAIKEEGILQVRSESRVGIFDMGVNQNRIDNIAYRLTTNQIN